jgi:hypothetical protein
MGYHSRPIAKGVYGEVSKIREELEELEDSEELGVKIMAMCELSDLYGALQEFAKRKYGLSMDDLKKMSDRTKEAFRDGTRS